MIIAIVNFKLPESLSAEDVTSMYEASVPRYQNLPGLIRKHYLLGDGVGGGVYLWNSRKEAEAFYGETWSTTIRERFGYDPTVAYYDSPITIENS